MSGRFTEIPQETFEQIVVDAGVLLRRFDLFDPDYDITPDIITATTGGVQLSAEPEIADFGEDVDNCPNNTKELARLVSWRCTVGSTAIGSSPEIMQMILGAADLSGDIDVIPRAALDLSDFKDLWWVGDRVDGGLLAVHIANALSISGLTLQTSKAAKGQFDFEIQAHVSIYEQDKVPMTFYVMGPGAGTITGLTVPDFMVQKGVPTRIPVKYVMQDGSEMDPTDYSHELTYTATLPPGATLTEDGILTLTGDNDSITITVTRSHGGETMTDTAVAEVERPYIIGIVTEHSRIVLPEDSSTQIKTLFVMSDGIEEIPGDYATGFAYTPVGLPNDVTISADGMMTSGTTGGVGSVTISYTENGKTFTTSVPVEIEGVTVTGISISETPVEVWNYRLKQIPVVYNLSNGTTETPNDYETDFTYSVQGTLPSGTTIGTDGMVSAGMNGGTFSVLVSYRHNTGETFTATASVSVIEAALPGGTAIFLGEYSGTVTLQVTTAGTGTAYIDWGDGTRTGMRVPQGTTSAVRTKTYAAGYTSKRIYVGTETPSSTVISVYVRGTTVGGELATNLNPIFNTGANITKLSWIQGLTGNPVPAPYATQLEEASYRWTGTTNALANSPFKGLTSLHTVTLSGTLANIYAEAFSGCTGLRTLDLTGVTGNTPVATSSNALDGVPKETLSILVPAALESAYKTATNWSAYADCIVGV